MAAVLACGPAALLSHRSAAVLWGIRPADGPGIDVIAPGRRGRMPKAINAHRVGPLRNEDRAEARGIACTSVPRTLLDLAATLTPHQLARAFGEAEVQGLLELSALRELIDRSRGRRGVARLRQLLDELHPQGGRSRNRMERRFLSICRRGGVPSPAVNRKIAVNGTVIEADFLWFDAGLIVETDGRQSHDTATAFERDRRRDQRATLAGWRVIRFTWRQIFFEADVVESTVRALFR